MLNAATSLARKEHGMQVALDFAGDWKTEVLLELRGWLAVHGAKGFSTMTFEQFRADAKNQPESHKAWGSLPGIACRAGLIAPLSHPDGSPVMRAAESVKTHGHHIRVWSLVSSFSAAPNGTNSPTGIQTQAPQAQRGTVGNDECGAVLHGGGTAALLAATADYHRRRDAMGSAG